MTEKIDLLVFDVDDLLIKTFASEVPKLQCLLSSYGLERLDIKCWQKAWGGSFNRVLKKLYPKLNKDQIRKVREYLDGHTDKLIIPAVANGPEVLQQLQYDFNIGILTSRKHLVPEFIQRAGYDRKIFSFCFTPKDTIYCKPVAEAAIPVDIWARQNGALRKWTYIGDHMNDFKFAQNADARFIAVTTGVTTKQQFVDAGVPSDHILDNITELPILLSNGYLKE